MKNYNWLGIYLLFVLVILCAFPVIVFFLHINNELIRSLCYIGASGGIGGTIYSIRGFYRNLGGGTFKPNWVWWYIFRPLMSIVVGVFAYFLIVGGLLSISNNSEVIFSKGIMFYCALAFLAGFSFTRFADRLDTISDTIFSKKNDATGQYQKKDNS
ncbi:MAG: hypothetical protein R2750_03345 [Bacteroidales bacterium]